MTVAVIPVKDFAAAKSRLSELLSPEERAGLGQAMLEDVLAAANDAGNVDALYLVGHDPALAALADGRATVIEEAANRGYNEAVETALTWTEIGDADALLVLPADVPLVTATEIDRLTEPMTGPGARIATARADDGTNGLLLAPPNLMATAFGPGSAARHRARAEAAGAEIESLNLPGLAFDIDTPQDLLDFCRIDATTRAHSFLDRHGIRRRLLG